MDWLWKILEKILIYFVFTVVSVIVSFSVVTGQFPPRKEDLSKAYRLVTQIYKKHQQLSAAQSGLTAGEVTLEQMAQLQELSLQRTKIAVELTKLLKAFPEGVPNPEVQTQLQSVANHLDAAEKGLEAAQKTVSQSSESSQ